MSDELIRPLLSGQKALIVGIANDQSIAYGFAKAFREVGADLAITWGKLWVKLRTHSAGGITDKDFALARKIEEVVLWRPQSGGPLEGTPNKFVHSK